MNRLFNDRRLGWNSEEDNSSVVTSHWAPSVDIKEEEGRFLLTADLPGVDPKAIDVTMEKGVLTIKGERSFEDTEEREAYKRVERAYGTFYRRFSLPEAVDAENITAESKNGVLHVSIPKHEKAQPRRIEVH